MINVRQPSYKISIIQHLKSKLIVAVIITPANVPDSKLLLLTLRQAITILGNGVMKTFNNGTYYRPCPNRRFPFAHERGLCP